MTDLMSKMIHGRQDSMERQKNIKKTIIIQAHSKIKIQISSIGKNNKEEVRTNGNARFQMIRLIKRVIKIMKNSIRREKSINKTL